MPEPRGQEQWIVLYDGACGFCKWILGWLLWLDRDQLLRPLALQRQEAERFRSDLDPDLWMASFHLVTPEQALSSAGEALPALLRLVRGGRLPAAILERFPALTARSYRWIADNRTALSRFVPRRWKRRAAERVREREALGFP